jgi:hypothetical protein
MPRGGRNRAKEGNKEVSEDRGLETVLSRGHPVDLEGGDSVTTQMTSRDIVEEFSVFVPFKGELNLSMGLPVDGSLFDGGVERVHSKGPEAAFKDRERVFFFQEVKEFDQNAAVFVMLGKRDGTTGPLLTPKTALTKTGKNTAKNER